MTSKPAGARPAYKGGGQPVVRQTLKSLHQILGVVGALYMLIMAATGTVLTFRDPILRFALPGLDAPAPTLAPADAAAKLAALEARYGDRGLRSIRLPKDGLKAYRLYLPHHRELLIDAETLEPVPDILGLDRFMQILFDLHHRLAMGKTGEQLVGLLGLGAVFSVLSGLYLWWPWRKGFRLALLKAKGGGAGANRGAHATLGILIAAPLLLSVATGAAMIYSAEVRWGLTALFGGARPVAAMPANGQGAEGLLKAAEAGLPGATATLYVVGRPSLRLRMPAEWHPNGRSTVNLKPDGAEIVDATQAAAGHRMADAIYPLHSGKVGGVWWQGFVGLTGLAALSLMVKALTAYYRRFRPVRR